MPKVLTVLSISKSKELEELLDIGVTAIAKERDKKELHEGPEKIFIEKLGDLEPHY